jgi:acyl-CoA synthetase (AMP-forming)/AMP-acid ligase II
VKTVIDLLKEHLQEEPGKVIYRYWQDGGITDQLSVAALDERSRAAAALLQKITSPGDRVIIALPQSLHPIVALFACLFTGTMAVPVPLAPVNRLEGLKRYLADAGSQTIITLSSISALLKPEAQAAGLDTLHWINLDEIDPLSAGDFRPINLSSDMPALMLYTSGSTNYPRGIFANQGNIVAVIDASTSPFKQVTQVNSVLWTPLHHSIGLIFTLQVFGYHGSILLFSPQAFIQKPITWLKLISEYRAYLSMGPIFAYRLCVEAVKPEERQGLDLSCWKVAMSGGEPIRLDVVRQFAQAYEPYGFSIKSFTPAYGMSESLGGFHAEMNVGPKTIWADTAALEQRRLVECSEGDPGARPFVSNGEPLPGYGLRIVDPDTRRECTSQEIGEIWISGPAVAQGYWNKPQETEEIFHARLDNGEGPYLRTGDLGFVKNGEIYICGRMKDVIIINGRNLSAIDIELAAAGAHPALMPGAAAAFGIELDGDEKVVLMYETRPGQEGVAVDEVASQVRAVISDKLKVPLHAFMLLKPGGLPRSSSGKIQRFLARNRYIESLAGEEN